MYILRIYRQWLDRIPKTLNFGYRDWHAHLTRDHSFKTNGAGMQCMFWWCDFMALKPCFATIMADVRPFL